MTPDPCRPFSKGRDGMTLGEGAAIFLLETEQSAGARGRAPTRTRRLWHDERRRRYRAAGRGGRIEGDRPGAGMPTSSRGTSTMSMPMARRRTPTTFRKRGDAAHLRRLSKRRAVSSTKPVHGHTLGASGGLELVITVRALHEQIAPPTINCMEADRDCPLDVLPNVRASASDAAMSNSFAFGGINAV